MTVYGQGFIRFPRAADAPAAACIEVVSVRVPEGFLVLRQA
jgi:hypothetical protein